MSTFTYEYGTLNIEPTNISTHTRRTSNIFNSTSKLQDFFGVDDIEELKYNTPQKRSSNKLKSIFTTDNKLKQTKKIQRESKKIRRSLNKLRKEKNQMKCKLLRKLTQTKSAPIPSLNINAELINTKILWRPTLKIILKDNILLNTLIQYMENSYNSENILFLQAVHALNNCDADTINNKIVFIYNKYVIPYSEYQINLSYHCLMNIMSKKDIFHTYNNIQDKRVIFDLCVEEIENLIITSVLNSFYASNLFQSNARKSKYYKSNHHPKYYHNNSPSNDSVSEYSPYASLSTPPIKIETSISAESFFEFDA